MKGRESAYPWRRERDRFNRVFDRVEDAPFNLLSRGLTTNSAKRKVYLEGIRGQAEILEAPGEHSLSDIEENVGRFRVRVELPGETPYEVKLTQSFSFGFEAAALSQGAMVECRVDPGNRKRVLLVAPEPDPSPDSELLALENPQRASAAATVAAGNPATGTVRSAEVSEIPPPPESDGQIWEITMELRAEHERKPWTVTVFQRVPTGAEELMSPGSELKVGYAKRKSNRDVAIDWPASTDGRFS